MLRDYQRNGAGLCNKAMLYYSLHWSEQLRVAPTISLTDDQQRELRG